MKSAAVPHFFCFRNLTTMLHEIWQKGRKAKRNRELQTSWNNSMNSGGAGGESFTGC
jgi:hypothetical protein